MASLTLDTFTGGSNSPGERACAPLALPADYSFVPDCSILRAHRHGKVILASAGGDGHVCIWVLELDHKSNYRRLKLLRRLNEPDQDQAIFCLAYREGTLFGGVRLSLSDSQTRLWARPPKLRA